MFCKILKIQNISDICTFININEQKAKQITAPA